MEQKTRVGNMCLELKSLVFATEQSPPAFPLIDIQVAWPYIFVLDWWIRTLSLLGITSSGASYC